MGVSKKTNLFGNFQSIFNFVYCNGSTVAVRYSVGIGAQVSTIAVKTSLSRMLETAFLISTQEG